MDKTFGADGNRQDAPRSSYRTGNKKIGHPNCLRSKKPSFLWFYVDYCTLNVVTIRNSYPLPRMYWFSWWCTHLCKLTCHPGIFPDQIRCKRLWGDRCQKSQWVKTICTDAIGLMNARSIFPGPMDAFLSSVKWKSALVCSDETVVFLKSVHKHWIHFRIEPTVLINAALPLT